MTDIVERLQYEITGIEEHPGGWDATVSTLVGAKAEIERLRAALAAENEECAKIADAYVIHYGGRTSEEIAESDMAAEIAAAIRQRMKGE